MGAVVLRVSLSTRVFASASRKRHALCLKRVILPTAVNTHLPLTHQQFPLQLQTSPPTLMPLPFLWILAGSHWESRLLSDDIMSAVPFTQRRHATVAVSALTLALLEDSGWYTANYSFVPTYSPGVKHSPFYTTSSVHARICQGDIINILSFTSSPASNYYLCQNCTA